MPVLFCFYFSFIIIYITENDAGTVSVLVAAEQHRLWLSVGIYCTEMDIVNDNMSQ